MDNGKVADGLEIAERLKNHVGEDKLGEGVWVRDWLL